MSSLQKNHTGPKKIIAKSSAKKKQSNVILGKDREPEGGRQHVPFDAPFAPIRCAVAVGNQSSELVADGKVEPPRQDVLDKLLPLTAPLDWNKVKELGEMQREDAEEAFAGWREDLAADDEEEMTDQRRYDLDQYEALIANGKPDEDDFFRGDHVDSPCEVPSSILYAAIDNMDTLNDMSTSNIHGHGVDAIGEAEEHGNVLMWANTLHPQGSHYDGEGFPNIALSIVKHMADKCCDHEGIDNMLEWYRVLFELAMRADFGASWDCEDAFGDILAVLMCIEDDDYRMFRAFVEASAGLVYSGPTAGAILRQFAKFPSSVERKKNLLALIAHRNQWRADAVAKFVDKCKRSYWNKSEIMECVGDKRAELAKWADDALVDSDDN